VGVKTSLQTRGPATCCVVAKKRMGKVSEWVAMGLKWWQWVVDSMVIWLVTLSTTITDGSIVMRNVYADDGIKKSRVTISEDYVFLLRDCVFLS